MQLVGSEPVFLPALHGGSLLICRLATVPASATPTLPCRTACRAAHPYQSFPLQGTILRQQHPRAFSEAGTEGRPEEVGQRPRRGAIYKVREIKDMALLKTLQLGEVLGGHL